MWSPLRARKFDKKNGLLKPFVNFEYFGNPKTLNCDRDSQGDVYFADMSLSTIRPKNLENLSKNLLPQKWMGQKIYPLKSWGACDIDYAWQIPGIVYWLKKNGIKKNKDIYNKQKSFVNLSKIKVEKQDYDFQIARVKFALYDNNQKQHIVDNQNEIIKNLKNDLFENEKKIHLHLK